MPRNLVPENSDFSYHKILLIGGLTILSINLVNYVCTAFAIMDYSVDVITQFYLPPCTVAERILCHFLTDNFEQYTCSIHESIKQGFYNRPVANVFFNNRIKLSTDSAVADCVKAFNKKREKSKLEIFINLFFYLIL